MPDEKFLKAYRDTAYIVDDDPPLVMKIGERSDALRILFASFNVESAAFITAFNPGSERLSEDENQDRQMDLLVEIEKLRFNYFVGRWEHPEEDCAEDSYLVLGVDKDQAMELAAQFGQVAAVWIGNTGIPELVFSEAP